MSETPSPVGNELDLRALRYFVAAAEELHFTRAAARLFVAQQALSREIAGLERKLGTSLFTRTTRRVALTPAGELLLVRARELVALHDLTWNELRPSARPVLVDLLSDGRLTAVLVLELARTSAPDLEFRAAYTGGMASVGARIVGGDLDAAFGRADWVGQRPNARLDAQLIRLEPLALLLPDDHPLAAGEAVPIGALRDMEIDANVDDPNAPEWVDLARQVLALAGARPVAPHPPAVGIAEASHHLRRQGLPILTGLDLAAVPGGVVRPLVEPTPLYPWSVVVRRGRRHEPGIARLLEAARSIAERERWLDMPADGWLPLPESARRPPREDGSRPNR